MGIKILRLRHRTAPVQNGCRWCGEAKQGHALRWVPGHRWHPHAEPTDAQRLARRKARFAQSMVPVITTNVAANDARTRL